MIPAFRRLRQEDHDFKASLSSLCYVAIYRQPGLYSETLAQKTNNQKTKQLFL
jgi:hypothetical protein